MKNTESLSIIVQWDEEDDPLPTTYIVTWTSERDHITHPVTLIEQSTYTITGLTLDTVYTITVTASNKCGQGPEYSTSVSLTTDASSTITNISTNTTTISVASPSSVTTSIVQHVPTASIIVTNPTTNTKTTTVSIITDVTGRITVTETTELKTTILSNNPSAVITTSFTRYNTSTTIIGIVMSSTSTVHIADTTTADETSKFSSSYICLNYNNVKIKKGIGV